jgi:predicted transcriptional regulator
MCDSNTELLNFFKALADANRLRIIGLLANRSYTVEQMAALLQLGPSTVSHHLSKLSQAGLVSARADSYYNTYSLETSALESMSKRLLAQDTLADLAGDVDLSGYERKVLQDYLLPDGRLKIIPTQRKKLEAVLNYIVESFEHSRRYTEKEVNQILAQFHKDTASLRRELVGIRLMQRDHGKYWRTEQSQ